MYLNERCVTFLPQMLKAKSPDKDAWGFICFVLIIQCSAFISTHNVLGRDDIHYSLFTFLYSLPELDIQGQYQH